jgi:hypothetical protein
MGVYPAFNATFITFGLSAMKIPFSGSKRLRNCASVRLANILMSGWDNDDISMMGMGYSLFSFAKIGNINEIPK